MMFCIHFLKGPARFIALHRRKCLLALLLAMFLNIGFLGPLQAQVLADYVMALVDNEPITSRDVQVRAEQLRRAEKTIPADLLQKQALESLIHDKVVLLSARDSGLQISDNELRMAIREQQIQAGLDDIPFRAQVEARGMTWQTWSQELRDQMLMDRFRMREMQEQPSASRERELEERMQAISQRLSQSPLAWPENDTLELNLGHILFVVPQNATPDQVRRRQQQAQQVLQQLRKGRSFSDVARKVSQASEGKIGGAIGLRPLLDYPQPFLDATQGLKVGQMSVVVRTVAGFHILKVLERRLSTAPASNAAALVMQTRARHILLQHALHPDAAQTVQSLQEIRRAIGTGMIDFPAAAEKFSEDASARQGGDLGWMLPGQLVPEFEQVMNHLPLGKISTPLRSRFGYHLLQVTGRRASVLETAALRAMAQQEMLSLKEGETYQRWIKGLREKLYIEYRDAPL